MAQANVFFLFFPNCRLLLNIICILLVWSNPENFCSWSICHHSTQFIKTGCRIVFTLVIQYPITVSDNNKSWFDTLVLLLTISWITGATYLAIAASAPRRSWPWAVKVLRGADVSWLIISCDRQPEIIVVQQISLFQIADKNHQISYSPRLLSLACSTKSPKPFIMHVIITACYDINFTSLWCIKSHLAARVSI